MKTKITQFKHCTFAVILLLTGWANAATYTAVSSGLWSSASTWGGVSPGASLTTLDNVIIGEGIDVTLDMDVEFTGLLSSLTVDGSLHSSSDAYMLDMDGGSLTGAGSLTLHNLRFGTLATMTFSGESSIDNMWVDGASLSIASDMELNDTLFLDEGTFNIASGGEMSLMSESVIQRDNGSLTAAGVLNNGDDYSVVYVGSDKTAGIELDGDGLTDVWVELDDNDQALSISGNVSIEGVLHHNHGMIDLNGGSLWLMNDYMSMSGATFMGSALSDLHIESASSLSGSLQFDEDNDDLQDLWINTEDGESNVNLASDLTIHGSLMLENGDLTTTSGTMTMAAGSEIVLEEGHLMNSGGAFGGDGVYNVTYRGSTSRSNGIELTGSGLNDLTIDFENQSDSVEVMNSLDINGALEMENGGMAMNGYDLVLDGSLSTTSTGWFAGDEESDLTFNTSSLINDTVWFHGTNNMFHTITINSADNSDLMIGNDAHVENINMSTAGVHMWDSELWLNSTGMINGADEDKYVMIDGSGSLVMNVSESGPYTMFPVGTDEGYAPIGLQQNSGSAGYFKVNTRNGVWENGTSGIDMALTGAMVNRTWDVSSEDGGSSEMDMNVMTMWQSGFEVNDFDNTDAYIMNYGEDGWDAASQMGSEAVLNGDMYQLERENMNSLGQFAVRDGSILSVNDNNPVVAEIYPNPVKDVLNLVADFDEATVTEVVDITGNVLQTQSLNGSVNQQIDFSAYPNGVYFVNYSNSKGTNSFRVVKSL